MRKILNSLRPLGLSPVPSWTDWDIVIGGVANDKVFDTLEAFFDGFATREQTIAKMRYEKPNLQVCFRTTAALATLKYIGSENV